MFYAQVAAVMAGEAPVESAEPRTLEFTIYNCACKVLASARYHREQMISDYPEGVRELVSAEVMRVYKLRRDAHLARKIVPPQVQYEKPTHNPDWIDFV